ncbi:class I SAM-dependent methyltransferase [Kineococcus gynurae]|uniref:Class I SAM-dependent methyltransferase n=1 Tax=Kineococcus gynurae TaxID=452979 RepID=A0ABV5LSY2_9ACTN
MNSHDVGRAYSARAQEYIDRLGSVTTVHPDDLAFIGRNLGRPSGPVVDLGCGPGHLTGHLHARGYDVRGIDPVPEFVSHARATYPQSEFEVGSFTANTLTKGAMAGALAWYSLIHLEPRDLDRTLLGIHELLAPGAILVVGFFAGAVLEPFEHAVTTAYRWPVPELTTRLAAAGFVQVDRLQRSAEGERRPHAALALRAG